MPTLLEISEQAKLLTPDEKVVLYHQLQAQLEEQPDPVIQELWRQEVLRRIEADRLNPEPTISHEDLMAELRTS